MNTVENMYSNQWVFTRINAILVMLVESGSTILVYLVTKTLFFVRVAHLDALEAVVPDLHGLLPGELRVAELGEEGRQEVQLQVHLAPLTLPLRLLLRLPPRLHVKKDLFIQ